MSLQYYILSNSHNQEKLTWEHQSLAQKEEKLTHLQCQLNELTSKTASFVVLISNSENKSPEEIPVDSPFQQYWIDVKKESINKTLNSIGKKKREIAELNRKIEGINRKIARKTAAKNRRK